MGRRFRHPTLRSLAVAGLALFPLAAQGSRDDLRDRVELKGGEVLRGRVAQRFEPESIELDVGGRRREVPRAKILRFDTVDDALAAFLDLRRTGLTLAAEWTLAETAQSMGLDAIARLQAYHVLLRDPDHGPAHAMLGHTGSPGKWRWQWEGTSVPASSIPAKTLGHRFTLRSEHFVLESRGGLRAAVDTLFDLERTYTAFWRELGAEIRPRAVFSPITVQVHGSLRDMPKLSTTVAEPYCDPTARGDGVVTTYQEGTMEHPARLVAVTIEELLYRTLLDPKATLPTSLDRRFAPWIEVGLGRYFESRGQGRPGYLRFGDVKLDRVLAAQVLNYRPYGLENFVHVAFTAFHEDDVVAPFHFAHAAMLVTYLMEPKATAGRPPVPVRPRFLEYVRLCFHEGKGNSSSTLDSALGKEIGRVENLETPWIQWLAAAAGQPAVRKKHLLRPRRSVRDLVFPGVIR
ncbi:MAG: hypothetical protein R3F56_18195 [Planctomycetota bacterium]